MMPGRARRIGIIGAGNIGGTLARLLVGAGHEVALSNSRGPETLRELAAGLGSQAHAMTVEDAARWGDIIVLALPWRQPEGLPSPELVRDKIVVDAMNPYRPDSGLYDLGDSTSSEETAKRLPGARLVKAFNTIYYRHLAERGRPDLPSRKRHAIFVAGDDEEATAVVGELIEQIGFAAIETGSLREGGRKQEPGSPIYNRPMTGDEARAALR